MTREIDIRLKELTHQIHRELLCQHLEQVKNLTPSFISSIKINLLINTSISNSNNNSNYINSNNPIVLSVEQTKEFLIKRLSDEINEMIRILQLTTYDEDEWMSDDLTIMKQKLVIICNLII
jgi:vinculin